MDSGRDPVRVLCDAMIRHEAFPNQSVLVPTTVNWGGHPITIGVAQEVPRTYRGRTREDTARDLEDLSRVVNLAKTGKLTCYSSQEIEFETWGLRRMHSLDPESNPFRDVTFHRCKMRYSRSIVIGGSFTRDWFREEKASFLATITDPRFRDLDKATGGHHSSDCYHLWTAELSDLHVFLTKERAFRNAFQNQLRLSSKIRIMTPHELGCFVDASNS